MRNQKVFLGKPLNHHFCKTEKRRRKGWRREKEGGKGKERNEVTGV
jgi:hypothetical protein